jgi:hypothetical protein
MASEHELQKQTISKIYTVFCKIFFSFFKVLTLSYIARPVPSPPLAILFLINHVDFYFYPANSLAVAPWPLWQLAVRLPRPSFSLTFQFEKSQRRQGMKESYCICQIASG